MAAETESERARKSLFSFSKKEKKGESGGGTTELKQGKRSLFSFGKKGKKEEETVTTTESKHVKKRLYLHIGPMGWESRFMDENGTQLAEPGAWEELSDEVNGLKRIEASVQDAVRTLSKQIKATDHICLLIDGANVAFSDNKPRSLVAHSGLMARKFGQELLNCSEVTYGFAEFPKVEKSIHQTQRALYAFIDARIVRNTLALFDKDGVKVVEMIPKSYLMIQRAFLETGKPYGAIQVGPYHTNVVLVNAFLGTMVIRRIPIGIITLAEAVAERLMMGAKDTLQSLGKGNWLNGVVFPEQVQGGKSSEASLHQSEQAQAMQPHMTKLLLELKETLHYFTYQRVSGSPPKLETFGECERIAGLREFLRGYLVEKLGLEFVGGPSLVELYTQVSHPMPCNLLKGSDKSLLTIGRSHYHYNESEGFIPDQEHKKKTALPSESTKEGSQEKNKKDLTRRRKESGSSTGSGRGRGRGRGAPPKKENFMSTLFSRSSKDGASPGQTDQETAEEQDRQYFALFGLLFFALLYWGWDQAAIMEKKYRGQSLSYIQQRQENDAMRKRLHQKLTNVPGLASTENLTKILWTEKFLALARHMDQHIWLSDIYLGKDARVVEGANVESTKMVIEGHVLPSTIGHLQKIARYLDAVLQDKEGFMSDFRSITFEGAKITGMDEDAIIDFTLLAHYDKNKRIETLKNEPATQGNGGQPGLKEMNNNIQQRERTLNSLVGGQGQ